MSVSNSSPGGAAAPIGPFAGAMTDGVGLTVHSLPVPVVGDERRTRLGRLKMLLVLLVCAGLFLRAL